jgi:hypothetical protein
MIIFNPVNQLFTGFFCSCLCLPSSHSCYLGVLSALTELALAVLVPPEGLLSMVEASPVALVIAEVSVLEGASCFVLAISSPPFAL